MSFKLFNLIDKKQIVIKFERAINDLRKGLPITLNKKLLIFACESIEQSILDSLDNHHKIIILDKNRAHNIGIKTTQHIGVNIDILSLEFINLLTLDEKFLLKNYDYDASPEYSEILEILRLAKLLPAALIIKNPSYNSNLINLNSEEIENYKLQQEDDFQEICCAPVNLEDTNQAKISAFRPIIGGQEHYAIIIGDIYKVDQPLVRVHSSCYTGDLLGSLSCDCGDQLRDSIKLISNSSEKAGMVIYLMQEGRGIGLTNKLRTYILQNKGKDTVEANLALGFDDDERGFAAAAKILKKLNIHKIKLITNNPKKAKSLEAQNITISKLVPLITEKAKKSDYFKVKVKKLGHQNLDV